MGTRLVLLRHGESEWNLANQFTGWTDVALSERGIQEAHQVGHLLWAAGYVLDEAHTSVLKRASETLWIAMKELDMMWLPVYRSWRLNERHPRFDSRYAGIQPGELPATESLNDALDRVLPYWQKIITPVLRCGRRVLVSAHGNSLRALVKHLDNIPDEEIPTLNIPTGFPLVYELDQDLKAQEHYYLGDAATIQEATSSVAAQASISKNGRSEGSK